MSPLTFKCKIKHKYRLDMGWLSKINTSDLSIIKNIRINYGNKYFKLAELFAISGNDFKNIKIINSNNKLDNIGHELTNKKITIHGSVGNGLAKNMNNGEIILKGNAEKNACSGMAGGSVFIHGNTGDGLCSLPTGKNLGLVDGFIYVQKNVGSNSIIRMRRGNILIGGSIGNSSCLEIISGTITILGKIGNEFFTNARRGTLFIKDKSITKHYIIANNTDLTFYNFYRININKLVNKELIKTKLPKRYFGTKNDKKLVEIFLL